MPQSRKNRLRRFDAALAPPVESCPLMLWKMRWNGCWKWDSPLRLFRLVTDDAKSNSLFDPLAADFVAIKFDGGTDFKRFAQPHPGCCQQAKQ